MQIDGMSWQDKYIRDYSIFIRLEKSLSANSQEAYLGDLNKFFQFLELRFPGLTPPDCSLEELREFVQWISELGLSAVSQSRVVSSIRGFYKFLKIEGLVEKNPASLLETPRIGRKLPDILTADEIDRIISTIDLSHDYAYRNMAIIEVLYGCGLRVSELTGLLISNINFKYQYLRIIGKGNKERLVPLGSRALNSIKNYIDLYRPKGKIQDSYEDFVFLNRFGKNLSRVMIFNIVKSCAENANISKSISPHSFRHSFASHLVEGGADLRAVQELLGHESILTTEIYTHLNREFLVDTIIRFHPRSNA